MTNTPRTPDQIVEYLRALEPDEGLPFREEENIIRALDLYRAGIAADGDVQTERRITYQYGVNKNQTRTGFTSYGNLHQSVREDTMGEVDIVKCESRTVTYGPWTTEP